MKCPPLFFSGPPRETGGGGGDQAGPIANRGRETWDKARGNMFGVTHRVKGTRLHAVVWFSGERSLGGDIK